MAKRLAALIFLALLAWGAAAMLQDRYLYFPDNPPRRELLAAAGADGLAPWPGADDYRGLRREPPGPARATLVLFHGNAGHAGHRAWYADTLGGLGLRLILAEYPGYGSRPGSLGEASLVADARETIARARRQFPGPLLVGGESLGAGVAAAAVGADPGPVSGLLLITPWDRLVHAARHHYPWLPLGLFLRDRYDSAANLAAFPGPVAVVVADQDGIVPAALGQALFEALPGTKRLWVIAGAGHNDWPRHLEPGWPAAVADFLLAPPPSAP